MISLLRRLFRVPDRRAAPQDPPTLYAQLASGIFERRSSMPRWDYVSMSGPYTTYRCDDDEEAVVRYARVHEDLAEAIALFARVNNPRVGQVCLLVDGEGQAILAWMDTHRGEFDLRFRWFGCRQAFDLLATVDPVNAAIWERLAYQEVLNAN